MIVVIIILFMRIFVTLFWICDILNMPFMEKFDTTYPLNTLFWIVFFIFIGGTSITIESD